jgi:hypothetical protein
LPLVASSITLGLDVFGGEGLQRQDVCLGRQGLGLNVGALRKLERNMKTIYVDENEKTKERYRVTGWHNVPQLSADSA